MSIKIKAEPGVSNKVKTKKRHGEEPKIIPVKVAKMKKRELEISGTASNNDVKVHKPKGIKQKSGKKFKKPVKASMDKRERRLLKLKSKKHSEVVMQLLPIWEQFRRIDFSKEKRCQRIQEVLKVSKNIIPDLCMAHDTSRILEDCVKHGTESQRWEIFGELHKKFVVLAKSRYARFVLLKLMKYGDKQHRLEMFKAFRGRIQRLTQHRFASEIIDTLYNDYATATQRNEMIQEFYGNRHALRLGEHESYNLEDTLKLHPDKSEVILNNLTVILINLVTKGLNKFSIVQHLLLEYLNSAFTFSKAPASSSSSSSTSGVTSTEKPSTTDLSQSNAAVVPVLIDESIDCKVSLPKSFNDNFTTLLEALIDGQLVPMLHTREGVRCALKILWACNPQKRKLLIKGLKTCIKNIAFNEHGHLFIIGLIDAVDDIVLLQKTVFREILDDLELFVMHPNARKVLLYMLSPRDSRHFSPQLINSILTPGDTNLHTKKLLGVRALEMRTSQSLVLPGLLNLAREKLTELFIGDASDPTNEPAIIACKDLGRLILLSEILDKSAPHNLNPDIVISQYNRSNDSTRALVVKCTIPESDLSAYKVSRQAALEELITCVLLPEFIPSGNNNDGQSKPNVSRDDLRLSRHKMAVALVEAYLAKLKNPDIKSFTGGNGLDNGEDEEYDDDRDDGGDDDDEEEVDEEVEEDDKHMSIDEIFTDLQIDSKPFIERPEGVIIIRRLLQGEKEHKTFTFGRLIMKNVPMKNLCSWTKCNRTCYLLVNSPT
uniref:PUM-HD domain-containing protein n=1 Tax=Trichobilharzia regenti TaxID=157069 RepID=A0AA85IYW7_TRIRE|nr:unnamed protein product [Trichobilharzia regenti]